MVRIKSQQMLKLETTVTFELRPENALDFYDYWKVEFLKKGSTVYSLQSTVYNLLQDAVFLNLEFVKVSPYLVRTGGSSGAI